MNFEKEIETYTHGKRDKRQFIDIYQYKTYVPLNRLIYKENLTRKNNMIMLFYKRHPPKILNSLLIFIYF